MKSRIILLIAAVWLGCLSRAVAIAQWPLTVTNIAELKSLSVSWVESAEWASTMPSSPAVYVLGYYTPDDRGGGMFEWDPNVTNAPDNGLYVATNGWSSGNGRWVRRLNGEVANVKMWGAKTDGITECSSQIQNAVHACAYNNLSDELTFPNGIYVLTNTIIFPRSLHLRGESLYVNITMHGTNDVFRTENAQAALTGQPIDYDHWVTFEDLTIYMDTNATSNAALVLCLPGEATRIGNLDIHGGGYGIRVFGGGAPGLQIRNVKVNDPYVAGVSVEGFLPNGTWLGGASAMSLFSLSGDHHRPDSNATASLVRIQRCVVNCSVYDFKAEGSFGGGLFYYNRSIDTTNGDAQEGVLNIYGGNWNCGDGASDFLVLNSDDQTTASVIINPLQIYGIRHLIRDDRFGRNIDPKMYTEVGTAGPYQSICRLPIQYESRAGVGSRFVVGNTALVSFLAPTTNAWYRVMGGTTNFPGTGHIGGRLVINSWQHSSDVSLDVTPDAGSDGAQINVIRATKSLNWSSPAAVTQVRAGSYYDPSVSGNRPFVDVYVNITAGSGDPGLDKIVLGYPIESDNLYDTAGFPPLVIPTTALTSLVPAGCTLNQCVTNSVIR